MSEIFYKNWKKAIVNLDTSIKSAIKNLNQTALKICFVYKKKKFYGTLTDGDIRRGLLRGLSLNSTIRSLINKNPKFVFEKDLNNKKKITKLNKNVNFDLVPVINNKKKIIGIFNKFENKINIKKLNYEMIVVAGGKGKRLMPITKKIPKALVKVNGKPILENIILKAKNEGISNFRILTHHMHSKIYEYFGNGRKLEVNIKYTREKIPLGTAGGITLLKSKKNKTLIVTNCDIITDLSYTNLINFHKLNKNHITIASRFYRLSNPYGVIKLNKSSRVLRIDEKPSQSSLISAGVYVINSKILKYFKKGQKIDMTEFINFLILKKIKIGTCPIHENWTDIGNINDLKKFKIKYE